MQFRGQRSACLCLEYAAGTAVTEYESFGESWA